MPHPHLFAVLFAAAVACLKHRSPAARPAGVDAGDARTRARARSHEGARIRVNLRAGARRGTQLGVELGRTEGVLSSTRSRSWAGHCLEPALSTRVRQVSGLQVVPRDRSQGWDDKSSLSRRGHVEM